MTLKLKPEIILPQGEYQTSWALHDDIDPAIFQFSYKFIIRSSNKNTFG